VLPPRAMLLQQTAEYLSSSIRIIEDILCSFET
jgi:hypothetical protein